MSGNVEFVGIQLDLRGEEEVYRDLQRIDNLLHSLGGRKKVDAGMDKLRRDLSAAKGELEKLKRVRDSLESKGLSSEGLNERIQQATYRVRDLQKAMEEVRTATRTAGDTMRQTFNKISSAVTHAGSKMQSLGNALTRLTTPFARFTSGIVMGAGYKALNSFTSGLESGFTRYDTMKKYPKVMEAFGYSAEQSEKSINALDQSVRGLPTGLDEMVDVAQRFTATTGDIEKGTKLAIAANNAFLASMSTDTQKYQGMMQLQDVLGGKDMNAREWNSLVSSMTPAIVKMGESLGYTSDNMSEFIQMVRDGDMANEDFIKTLIEVGTEEGEVAKMAQNAKDTWQAFFANVGNAASRMVYGIIKSFDAITQAAVGKDVNQFLSENVIGGIDQATEAVKNWIAAHPEAIKQFFKDLSGLDIKGFFKGFADGMLEMARFVQMIAKAFNGKDLSWFGKWMMRLNILGKALTIFGGVLKGLSHPIAAFGTVFARLFKGVGRLGLFSKLKGLFGNKKDAAEIQSISNVAKGAVNSMVGVLQLAGTALIGAGTGYVVFKAFKSMMNDFKDITATISEIDWNAGKKALAAMGGFFTAFLSVGALLGTKVGTKVGIHLLWGEAVAGALTTLASGIAAVDMKLLKSAFKDFNAVTVNLKSALTNLKDIRGMEIKPGDFTNIIAALNVVSTSFNGNNKAGMEGFRPIRKNLVEGIKNFADSMKAVIDAVKSLNQINEIQITTENVDGVVTKLQDSVKRIGEMFDFMPESFKNGKAAQSAQTMKNTFENVNSAFKSLTAGDGILTQLPMIVSAVQNINLDSIKTQFAKLGDVITTIYTSLQGIGAGEYFASNIDNFRAGLKSLKFAIKHLQEISGMTVDSDIVGKIQTIISNLQTAFDAGKISSLSGTIQTFVQAIKAAMQGFEELNQEIEINASVKLSAGFESSVNTVVSKIKAARKDIKDAWSLIPRSLTRNISVSISASVNTSGAISAISRGASAVRSAADRASVSQATGGMIYRARGGNVPFKRRGTDTIPAMLTPGEYVHNKRAVNMFGIDFMRKVNNLDMRGAMNELMSRAGHMANVGRQTTVNNNYYNNQKVTQNINTNSPDFAFRSASRFAGAF